MLSKHLSFRRAYLTLSVLFNLNVYCRKASCPPDANNLFRLNQSRFFVVQRRGSIDELVEWPDAQAKCEQHDLNLATIDSYGEDAVVGRALEKFIRENNIALGIERYAKYWIDAKYDPDEESYMSVRERKKLEYFNLLYKAKTVGYGSDLSIDGNEYKPRNPSPDQCLTYGLSFKKPGSDDDSLLGYETRMEETNCESTRDSRKRFVLCEASKQDCPNPDDKDPFLMTDTKEYYLNKGNWIFGNPRRFAVNWQPRTYEESIEYCEERGMKLYRPAADGDGCLIPYLGLWNKRITTATFWTQIQFGIGTKRYIWPNGEEIFIGSPYANATTRSSREKLACVMSSYSYEALGSNDCRCQWNSMILAPANCEIKMATICSHVKLNTNVTLGSCDNVWGTGQRVYDGLDSYEGRQGIVNKTHTLPFGSNKISNELYRSTYKQPFGHRLCSPGYKMAESDVDIPTSSSMLYQYDAQEDYWVVERLRGFHLKEDNCILSAYDANKNERKIKTGVNCNEWHFYLCEQQ